MKKSKKKIKILSDGPYELEGDISLQQEIIIPDENGISTEWKRGKKYEYPKGTCHICRCGHSKNKPFCDGTHKEIGFDGTETADNTAYFEAAQYTEGKVVDLLDQESLCAYARFCDRGARIWNLVENYSDKESVDLAIEEAAQCPAGRLSILDKTGAVIEPELDEEITVVEDTAEDCQGPLWVKGGIEIEGSQGVLYEKRNRVTLCRCGESSNKPFCDGTHVNCPHMKGLDK